MTEREKFEKWWVGDANPLADFLCNDKETLERYGKEHYFYLSTQEAWITWQARAALESSTPSPQPLGERWISVKEKLPPRHQNVLCFNRGGIIFEGRICTGMHAPFFTYPRGDGNASNTAPSWIDVTHWQPLPEPPKELL